MSDPWEVLIKAEDGLDAAVVAIVQALQYSGAVFRAEGGYYDLIFAEYQIFAEKSFLRQPDALPNDWYSPFDSYPVRLLFLPFDKTTGLGAIVAKKAFEDLKKYGKWPWALAQNGQTIVDRFYPPTAAGEEAKRIDEEEAAVIRLPTYTRAIYIQSSVDVGNLAAAIAAILSSSYKRSQLVANLTKKTLERDKIPNLPLRLCSRF